MEFKRLRRNRKTSAIRSLVEETRLTSSDFVVPIFVIEGTNKKEAIEKMPGVFRFSVDLLVKEAEALYKQGIVAIALFPKVDAKQKDETGSSAFDKNGLIPNAVKALKKALPKLCVICDVALDPYTSHGHDGVIDENGNVLNDPTLKLLCRAATVLADAGVDIIAPSDMMDGRIKAIRQMLDIHGYFDVNILSYSAKFASKLYAPFRSALDSAPAKGDKKGYQLNPANLNEALLETKTDEEEGADMLLVKPALFYLDILCKVKERTLLPVGAYHVGGEYAMVMAADKLGYLDAKTTFYESLLCIKRAGASFIFTYAAPQILDLL